MSIFVIGVYDRCGWTMTNEATSTAEMDRFLGNSCRLAWLEWYFCQSHCLFLVRLTIAQICSRFNWELTRHFLPLLRSHTIDWRARWAQFFREFSQPISFNSWEKTFRVSLLQKIMNGMPHNCYTTSSHVKCAVSSDDGWMGGTKMNVIKMTRYFLLK